MFTYPIDNKGEFQIDDVRFHIDISPGRHRRPSDEWAFTLVKDKSFLDLYAQLSEDFYPTSILELGIFQGGSFVLLDKIFQPKYMSAVDISDVPVVPLLNYIQKNNQEAHILAFLKSIQVN